MEVVDGASSAGVSRRRAQQSEADRAAGDRVTGNQNFYYCRIEIEGRDETKRPTRLSGAWELIGRKILRWHRQTRTAGD
jgi:hypothetical protein